MGYIILGILTIFLAVVGFVEILKILVFSIYKVSSKNAVMLIIPERSENNNPEYFLRSYAENLKWMGVLRAKRILCISDRMTEEGKKIASLMCDEYDFLDLVTSNELSNELCNILNQNVAKKDC